MTDDSGAKWRLTADGRMYRKARQEYVNGDIYDGEWVDGKREGRGVYVYKNGNKYVGEFVAGMREASSWLMGIGTIEWLNSTKKGDISWNGVAKEVNLASLTCLTPS